MVGIPVRRPIATCSAVMSEKPTKGFGLAGDRVEVEVRDRLRRAVAALECLDDVHLGVGEERVQIGRALLRRSPAT